MWRMKDPGITNVEVAKRMGIAVSHLNTLITDARKEGWLVMEDPMLRLEHEIIPKTVDNLNLLLDQRDKQATLETAKGILFPQFKETKGISDQTVTALAIKIEMPDNLPNGPEVQVLSGTIVGRPKIAPD